MPVAALGLASMDQLMGGGHEAYPVRKGSDFPDALIGQTPRLLLESS